MTDSVKDLLKQYEQEVKKISSLNDDATSRNEDIDSKIYSINEIIIQKEESQKLRLRDKLTKTVTKFIWIQLIFFNIMVLLIVLSVRQIVYSNT